MTDFNLATADKHQLKYYASNELGLNLPLTMGEDTMRAKIQDHCKENDLEAPVAKIEAVDKKTPYVTINIAKQDKKGGSEPAFVGVQGVGYTIPRGLDIAVPASVVEVLKNAKQDIITQDPDDGSMHTEAVYTYPFQVVAGG